MDDSSSSSSCTGTDRGDGEEIDTVKLSQTLTMIWGIVGSGTGVVVMGAIAGLVVFWYRRKKAREQLALDPPTDMTSSSAASSGSATSATSARSRLVLRSLSKGRDAPNDSMSKLGRIDVPIEWPDSQSVPKIPTEQNHSLTRVTVPVSTCNAGRRAARAAVYVVSQISLHQQKHQQNRYTPVSMAPPNVISIMVGTPTPSPGNMSLRDNVPNRLESKVGETKTMSKGVRPLIIQLPPPRRKIPVHGFFSPVVTRYLIPDRHVAPPAPSLRGSTSAPTSKLHILIPRTRPSMIVEHRHRLKIVTSQPSGIGSSGPVRGLSPGPVRGSSPGPVRGSSPGPGRGRGSGPGRGIQTPGLGRGSVSSPGRGVVSSPGPAPSPRSSRGSVSRKQIPVLATVDKKDVSHQAKTVNTRPRSRSRSCSDPLRRISVKRSASTSGYAPSRD